MTKDRKIIISMSELRRIKQEAIERATKELLEKSQDILIATAEDDLYLLLVTGLTALAEMGYSEETLFNFADRVANIQVDINNGKRDLTKMERRLQHEHGLTLRKEHT